MRGISLRRLDFLRCKGTTLKIGQLTCVLRLPNKGVKKSEDAHDASIDTDGMEGSRVRDLGTRIYRLRTDFSWWAGR